MTDEFIYAQQALLGPELTEHVVRQWRSFLTRCNGSSNDIAPTYLNVLPKVWSASDFVALTCVSNPALLLDLINSGDLCRRYEGNELARRVASLRPKTEADLMRGLRRLRMREMVRIAWRDIAGWSDLDEVMETTSELADTCVNQSLLHLYKWQCERLGTPLANTGDQSAVMIVLALGKLGGGELNFSSDIDLIFAYSDPGETTHPSKPISNHEFFLKLARSLIKVLGHQTEDGFVFRVDMRLRPNGSSGPLALSFDAMEQYYQTHGRDWERYALVKARPIAGDEAAGKELLSKLHPFVYRRYLDFGAFEAVRSMKEMINRELLRKGVQNNLKLGQGGIREIEFIAQSFQLIRGGREPSLQTNRLIPALHHLGQSGIIDERAGIELIDAYRFLRKLEHGLQMIRDQQTHRLPESEIDRKRLLISAGMEQWSILADRVSAVCDSVHRHFEQIFIPVGPSEPSAPDALRDLWHGLLDSAVAHKALAEIGYRDTGAMINEIRALRSSRVYQAHSKYGRERLDKLVPLCVREAGQTADPDSTLVRIIRFIEGVGRRSAYLVLLIENPLALSQLVRLIGSSPWISSCIRQHPLLLDELLDPISASAGSSPEAISAELEQRLFHVGSEDLEQQMDILREVCHGQNLQVAAADVSNLIDWVEVGRRLSMIAETALGTSVRLCISGMTRSLGRPSVDPDGQQATLGVVAYGKLGSMELGYNSDLDIVFLHHGAKPGGCTQGGERSVDNGQYYSRLVQRIVHVLTTRTGAGVLYEIDMRLRPSGRAGPVVSSIDGFHSYQLNHAWTWEHQALVRARMFVGPEALRQQFEMIRQEVLCQQRDPARLRLDIKKMRAKVSAAHDASDEAAFDLKHGAGGIVDIEFIVQYCVLKWAHEYPAIVKPRNNIDAIGVLSKLGLIEQGEGTTLAETYYDYLQLEHQCKLAEQPPLIAVDQFKEQRGEVTRLWAKLFD